MHKQCTEMFVSLNNNNNKKKRCKTRWRQVGKTGGYTLNVKEVFIWYIKSAHTTSLDSGLVAMAASITCLNAPCR